MFGPRWGGITTDDGNKANRPNREIWAGLPRDERPEFERTCFDRSRKALRDGVMTEYRFGYECGFGAENCRKIAYMYLYGDGVEKDFGEYMRFMGRACEYGDRAAGWEVLEIPESQGEPLSTGSPRCIAARALGFKDGGWDPSFLREVEECALECPEAAAAVWVAGGYDTEARTRLLDLAGDAFEKDMLMARACVELHRGDCEDGIAHLRKAADLGDADSMFELGMRYFAGRGAARDPAASLEYLLRAAEHGCDDARPWLGIFEPIGGGRVPGPGGPHRERDHGRTFQYYQLPGDMPEEVPEWTVLLDLCDSDPTGSCCGPVRANGYGGFENSVFMLSPYYWGMSDDEDREVRSELPNFLFKPTGFEMRWYKYAFRDCRANRPLTVEQMRRMWRICIQSVLDQYERGELH